MAEEFNEEQARQYVRAMITRFGIIPGVSDEETPGRGVRIIKNEKAPVPCYRGQDGETLEKSLHVFHAGRNRKDSPFYFIIGNRPHSQQHFVEAYSLTRPETNELAKILYDFVEEEYSRALTEPVLKAKQEAINRAIEFLEDKTPK